MEIENLDAMLQKAFDASTKIYKERGFQRRIGFGSTYSPVHAPILDHSRSSRKGCPSSDGNPGPRASTAAIMRPLRPRIRSA